MINVLGVRVKLLAVVFSRQPGFQVFLQGVGVVEWNFFGRFFDKEPKRIDDRHVGYQIDRDTEFCRLLFKRRPGQEVAVRVLLPVEKVVCRANV